MIARPNAYAVSAPGAEPSNGVGGGGGLYSLAAALTSRKRLSGTVVLSVRIPSTGEIVLVFARGRPNPMKTLIARVGVA